MKFGSCDHIRAVEAVKQPIAYECEECVKSNDRRVHLRTCQSCGVTLCYDSSPNKHASAHARSHGHPVVKSAEPSEDCFWCYTHKTMKDG